MNLDDYPLLPVVEEVVAGYRSPLEAEGWTIEVEPNRVPGTVSVKLEHPLVPGSHGFSVNRLTTPERARRFLVGCFRDHYQFELVRNAPVRPERQRLLRRLWAAARVPTSEAASGSLCLTPRSRRGFDDVAAASSTRGRASPRPVPILTGSLRNLPSRSQHGQES